MASPCPPVTSPSDSAALPICIVVPAYNEARRFDAEALHGFLAAQPEVRFILVDDGSKDGTLDLLKACATRAPERVRVLSLHQNMGKAEAVRRGMVEAFSTPGVIFAGYWDADWATPLSAIPRFAECLRARPDVDIVLGARVALLGRTIVRKAHRHYLGRITATAASLTLALPVYDTQCGAKLMRNSEAMRSLWSAPFLSGWVFDVELIARYQQIFQRNEGLYELPVDQWTDKGESHVKATDFVRAFGDLVTIYRHYKLPARYQRPFDLLTARFTRYAGAGALGTVAHYATLMLSVEMLGLRPSLGAGLGATVGALINYLLNYHFIFTATRAHRETVPRFAAVAALGVAINAGIVRVCSEQLGLHYLLAQVLATLVVLSVGYVLNKTWTFGADARKR